MISTNEALQIVLENTPAPQTQKVSLRSCIGRILAENIVADRDFPPFNRVAMDGIAVAFEAGKTKWQIENRQYAGEPQKRLSNPENCIEVMTGAVLPEGTDTVIRYEDFIIEGKRAALSIDYQELKLSQNVHQQGSNRTFGDILIEAGSKISPAEMGVIASVGKTEVLVNHIPSVAIISTGDELVDIDQIPLPHQKALM